MKKFLAIICAAALGVGAVQLPLQAAYSFTVVEDAETAVEKNMQQFLDMLEKADVDENFTKDDLESLVAQACDYSTEATTGAGFLVEKFKRVTPTANQTCTRAQILTFLWRAVGSPKTTIANPFSDLNVSDYFYDAALWAYDKGMVSGDKFEGPTPCTRASTVMYLWKNADSPEYGDMEVFDDVSADAEYCDAVSWAVLNDVTAGVSDTEFAPDAICSRAQIVTFLQRAIAE